MGYLSDTRMCDVHGFILSPQGSCVRCESQKALLEGRRRAARLGTVGVVAVAVLGVSLVLLRPREPVALAATESNVTVPAPVARTAADDVPVIEEQRPAPLPPPAVEGSDNWDQRMAKAEADRAAAEAARVAAARKQLDENLAFTPAAPDPVITQGVAEPAPPREPSMWDEHQPRTYRRSSNVRVTGGGNSALPSTMNNPNPNAWLPPAGGGNFGNHRGGH